MIDNKYLPYNRQLEIAFINALIFDTDLPLYAKHIFKPEYLFDSEIRAIYIEILERTETGLDLDGPYYASLIDKHTIAADIATDGSSHFIGQNYIKELIYDYKRREMIRLAFTYRENMEIKGELIETTDNFITAVDGVLKINDEENEDNIEIISDRAEGKIEELKKVRGSDGNDYIGYSTGYYKLDGHIGGIIPKTNIILGAYTNTGKTTMFMCILKTLMRAGVRCAYFSTDEAAEDLYIKLTANILHHSVKDIYMGRATASETAAVNAEIKKAGLIVYDNYKKLDRIRIKIEQIKKSQRLDIVFVDYLQGLQGGNKLFEKMVDIADNLREMCKDYNLSIISASQIDNQTQREDQHGKLIAFKGGGELAAACDVALMLTPDSKRNIDNEKHYLNLAIMKNRFGGKYQMNYKFTDTYSGIYEI